MTRFGPGGSATDIISSPEEVTGIAGDPSTGALYVSHGSSGIKQYAGCAGPGCPLTATFGAGVVGRAGALAVDGDDGTIFTIDHGPYNAEVAVFYPDGVVPEASTGTNAPIDGQSATVWGQIDPDGAPPVSGCRFEYVDIQSHQVSRYRGARSAPCEEPFTSASPKGVSSTLTGLEEGTTYRYRLVAESAGKRGVGVTNSFTGPDHARATTGPAANVGGAWRL